MGRGTSKVGGTSGGGSSFSAELTGANTVKKIGASIYEYPLKVTPGSYDILYNDGSNITTRRENGQLFELNNRLFGFSDTPGEDGYTITDIKTGRVIGRTHPKTDGTMSQQWTISGKTTAAVKNETMVFTDGLANASAKAAVKNAEEYFKKIKQG